MATTPVNIKTRLAQICFKNVLIVSLNFTFSLYLIPETQSCIELFFNTIIKIEKVNHGFNIRAIVCNNKNTDEYKVVPYKAKAVTKNQKKFKVRDDINIKFFTTRIKYLLVFLDLYKQYNIYFLAIQ